MDRYYLGRNKQKFGPYTHAELMQHAASGRIVSTDMLLQEGAQKWMRASSLKGLFATATTAADEQTGRNWKVGLIGAATAAFIGIAILSISTGSDQGRGQHGNKNDSQVPEVAGWDRRQEQEQNAPEPQDHPNSAMTERERQYMQAMLEAMRQQQQQRQSKEYDGFKRGAEQLRICQTCGGAGSYRFVDGNGVLQLRQCPRCMGSGRNW